MSALARIELGRLPANDRAWDAERADAHAADAANAVTASRDVSLLLHLSDTHFGTEDAAVLEALVDLALRERPQAVVATGDITQHARPEEFAAAARFFARLAARHLVVVPGNHDLPLWDLPQRLLAPYSGFREAFGDELQPRLQSRDLWLAGLCTTRRWRHHEGTLSTTQVVQTAAWLAAAPAHALRVVAMHHPLAAAPAHDEADTSDGADTRESSDSIDSTDVLPNAAFATETWARAGVHLVLSGHTHRPCFLPLLQRPSATGAPCPATSMWAVQAGTAVSRHLRGQKAHSVNLLRRVGAGGWRVEQWTHAADAREFVMSDWLSMPAAAVVRPSA